MKFLRQEKFLFGTAFERPFERFFFGVSLQTISRRRESPLKPSIVDEGPRETSFRNLTLWVEKKGKAGRIRHALVFIVTQ